MFIGQHVRTESRTQILTETRAVSYSEGTDLSGVPLPKHSLITSLVASVALLTWDIIVVMADEVSRQNVFLHWSFIVHQVELIWK